MALDRIARRYGTHPGAVLRWSRTELAIAALCAATGEAATADAARDIGMVFPTIPVG